MNNILGWGLVLLMAAGQFGQSRTGELRVTVSDSAGLPVRTWVELTSSASGFRERLETDSSGIVVARRVPFGTYRVIVVQTGFAPFSGVVEVESALPTDYHVTLGLGQVQSQVTVRADDTLIDPRQTGAVQRIGRDALARRGAAPPGRALADLVNMQPGWLLEANGILHPRGAEYQTQYVVDGLPVTDNRSAAFAPEVDAEDVRAITILTGGYPAEYGRKLGGVIEVVTVPDRRTGFHGRASASTASSATRSGDALATYGWARSTLSLSGGLAATDRYLDPPVEDNFTNHGSVLHGAAELEHDLGQGDRVGLVARRGRARFLVPNELVQQQAGQRQDRESGETAAQVSYRHIFPAPVVLDVRGMAREAPTRLRSNRASTPMAAWQDRSLRELYVKSAVTVSAGVHEWKAGADFVTGTIHERFGYHLTNPGALDPATPPDFRFEGRGTDQEQAWFVQDEMRLGPWTVNAGLRWDRYHLVVDDSRFSPRLAAAWSWPAASLVVHASYDRVFQTPAVENLLLASSPAVDALSSQVARLPVRPSAGDFFEAGVSKALRGVARVDGSWFYRRMRNFADDDLLLNTGVSFPIAFRRADVRGVELRLGVPQWRRLSGFFSYAWMRGVGDLPVTGGLFLGEEAALLQSDGRFPISQDQRHTARGQVTWQATASAWVALAGAYGSGLPFEFEGDPAQALAEYGPRIVERLDFGTGRVRPSLSIDASAGLTLARSAGGRVGLQVDVRNLTNRLDVVNFAGLFSGTALAPPRSVSVRLRADF